MIKMILHKMRCKKGAYEKFKLISFVRQIWGSSDLRQWKLQYCLSCQTSIFRSGTSDQSYPQRKLRPTFCFIGSTTFKIHEASRYSHDLRYWRGSGQLLFSWRIHKGWIFGRVSASSTVYFPKLFLHMLYAALRYFYLSAFVFTLSCSVSGFKTCTYYSMRESDKINRFWHIMFYYQFRK